jgi:hypothetical protein
VIYRVKHQAFPVRTDQHELLFAAAYKPGDCNAAALGHGISKLPLRLLTACVCAQGVSVRLAGKGVNPRCF